MKVTIHYLKYGYPEDEPLPLPDRLVWVCESGGYWHTEIVAGSTAIGLAGVLPDGRPWRSAKGDFW